jgi:hypothetical protein
MPTLFCNPSSIVFHLSPNADAVTESRRISKPGGTEAGPRRNVMTVPTTTIIFLTDADLAAEWPTVVMELSTLRSNVITELGMATSPTDADPLASFPTVVTVLLMTSWVRLVMMETISTVTNATLTANLNAVMVLKDKTSNATKEFTTLTTNTTDADETVPSTDAVMEPSMLARSVMMVLPTVPPDPMLAEPTVFFPSVVMESLMPVNNVTEAADALLLALFSAVTESLMLPPLKNVITELPTLLPFPMLADPEPANFPSVVMVFEMITKLAIVELMTDGARLAKSFAEMESSMSEKSVMMESTTLTLNPTLVEPTACCGTAVTVSWMTLRNVTRAKTTRMPLTLADPGAESPTAVMESLILPEVRPVMMEMKWTVTDVLALAKRNAVTDVLTLEKSVTMDLETLILALAAADPSVSFPSVVMALLMLVRNVMMELPTPMLPTLADLTVLSPSVVMVLLITSTVSTVTKDPETV